MSTEENRALIRRCFAEVVNRGDLDRLAEFIAPTYVNHDMPAPEPGPNGLREVLQQFISAFPDFHISIEDVIAEGDRVATRGVFSGTQRGDFMGVPATGRSVTVPYMDVWRLEGGKAVENWVRIDTLGLMQQLGAVPGPEHAPS